MALVNGKTQLGFKFITTTNWNDRVQGDTPAALTTEELASGDIIFIEATNQIFAGGAFFGVTPQQAQDLSTLWSDIETADTGLKAKVTNLEDKVGTEAKLSQTLLAIANDLKSKLDGGNYYTGEGANAGSSIADVNGTSYNNVVDALNALNTLVSNLTTGVASINGKTGAVVLDGSDIMLDITAGAQSSIKTEVGKRVVISPDNQDNTVGPQSGMQASQYTTTKIIGDAIEAAHQAAAEAAVAAQSAADNSIATSPEDDTNKPFSGIQGAKLTNAAAIATAIENAYRDLIGISDDWVVEENNAEAKTLGTLRTLIATLRTDFQGMQKVVGTITDEQIESVLEVLQKLRAELEDPTGAQGIQSFLDKAYVITGGAQGADAPEGQQGKFETKSGADGVSEYAANLGEIITNLEKEIKAAKDAGTSAGVTDITAGAGIQSIGGIQSGHQGNITISATSGAKTIEALGGVQFGTAGAQSGKYGAETAQNSTVQTALQDINNVAASGEYKADTALTKLTWIVA